MKNIMMTLHDPGYLHTIPKTKRKRQKIDKLDLIKIKNFCGKEDTIKKVKKPTE